MKPKMESFSSLEKMGSYTTGLGLNMTILPSSLQRNHHHTIAQFEGQECPSSSKKKQCLKTWHENKWRTRYHISTSEQTWRTRENDKLLNAQPPAQGIKNTIPKVGLKMLSAYNLKNSFVPIKDNIVTWVQLLYFISLIQAGLATL